MNNPIQARRTNPDHSTATFSRNTEKSPEELRDLMLSGLNHS